jgi:phosphatidylserine decarboxylase
VETLSVIQFFNQSKKKLETETVYGGHFVSWAYETSLGRALTRTVFSKRGFSRILGAFENSKLSVSRIAPFVDAYGIDLTEFEKTEYASFNEFFIRKFKPGMRSFTGDERIFSAGAEARYLAFGNIKFTQKFSVKGFEIDLGELLKDPELGAHFEGGTLLLARLCPVDYHRFHFPVSGQVLRSYRVPGALHSVNPVAFASEPKVFLENEREISILETKTFGKVAMIEVGALGVGKIVQSAFSNRNLLPHKFEKGQEKGYFLFGGSTVIWLVEKGKMEVHPDLIEYGRQGIEVWVKLGSPLGEIKA